MDLWKLLNYPKMVQVTSMNNPIDEITYPSVGKTNYYVNTPGATLSIGNGAGSYIFKITRGSYVSKGHGGAIGSGSLTYQSTNGAGYAVE